MAIVNDFDINEATTPKPWGAKEEQVIRDLIKTLTEDTISGVKNVTGHKHGKLYNSSAVAKIDTSTTSSINIIMGDNLSSGLVIKDTSGNSRINIDSSLSTPVISLNSDVDVTGKLYADLYNLYGDLAIQTRQSSYLIGFNPTTGGGYSFRLDSSSYNFKVFEGTSDYFLILNTGTEVETLINTNTIIDGDLDVTGTINFGNLTVTDLTVTNNASINDLDVTTNIDTATLATTGNATIQDLDVTTNIDAATGEIATKWDVVGELYGNLYDLYGNKVIDTRNTDSTIFFSSDAGGGFDFNLKSTSESFRIHDGSTEIFHIDIPVLDLAATFELPVIINDDLNITGAFTSGGILNISNSTNALQTGHSWPIMYGTVDTGAAYPFLEAGHLVIQARQTAGRDIVFVTGATPAIRMTIDDTGLVQAENQIRINEEGLLLNRSTGYGYLSWTDGAATTQWSMRREVTNNVIETYSGSGLTGYFKIGSYTNRNQFVLNSSNGYMGVNTTNPQALVHISGGNLLLNNADEIRFYDSTTTQRTAVYLDSSNQLNVGTSAGDLVFRAGAGSYTEWARITTGGAFNVKAEGIRLNRSGGSGYIQFQDGSANSNWMIYHSNTDNYLSIYSANGVDGKFQIGSYSNSNLLFVDCVNGRVGIDTSSPVYTFDANGIIHTSSNIYLDNNNSISQFNNAATLRQILSLNSSNDLKIGGTVDGGLLFYYNLGNLGMTLDNSGNLGIGVTPSGTFKLEVSGYTKTNGITNRTSFAGVNPTPTDENTFELGPGYLNLNRDDTASIRQIQFGKNGSLHSGIQTSTSGFEIVGSDGIADITITSTGATWFANQVRINEEGLVLNRGGGSGYIEFTEGSGTGQWSIRHANTNNELRLYSKNLAGDFIISKDFNTTAIFFVDTDIGESAFNGKVSITDNNPLSIGADYPGGTSRTDNTNKKGIISTPHYDTDEEEVCIAHVYAQSGVNQLYIGGGDSSVNCPTTLYLVTGSTSTTTGGLNQLYINSSGNIFMPRISGTTGGSDMRYNTSTSEIFYDTSALKFKENIRNKPDTKWIYNISVKLYDRKDGSRFNEIGIIADDLMKIKPEYCSYNEEGEVLSYSKSDLVPVLISEIQSHEKEIKSLKKEISKLKKL